MNSEIRYHFPTFEQEQRSKEKYIQIRLAVLKRCKNEANDMLNKFAIQEPPRPFDIFEPIPKISTSINALKGFISNIRIPSNAYPNNMAPIKTMSVSVPKEPVQQKQQRPFDAPKVNIPVPGFREITSDENPNGQSDIQEGVTEQFVRKAIPTHAQIELIEKSTKSGREIRVAGPKSLLYVHSLNEYNVQQDDPKVGIHTFLPLESYTYVHPNWPARVWDEEYQQMTDNQLIEQKDLIDECKQIHENNIASRMKSTTRQTKSKTPRLKVMVGNFITDSSEDLTEPEDYLMGTN